MSEQTKQMKNTIAEYRSLIERASAIKTEKQTIEELTRDQIIELFQPLTQIDLPHFTDWDNDTYISDIIVSSRITDNDIHVMMYTGEKDITFLDADGNRNAPYQVIEAFQDTISDILDLLTNYIQNSHNDIAYAQKIKGLVD